MQVFPALKARMGNTDYYIVRMRLDDIGKNVDIVGAPYEYSALAHELQRKLNHNRVKTEINKFLKRDDRFFSSIVVATIGGSPTFRPVRIDDGEGSGLAALFTAGGVDEAFGLLAFTNDVKFYALDGQHRLESIKQCLSTKQVPDISGDHMSVVLVVDNTGKKLTDKEAKKRRQLFSWLNRYAKKPTKETDIIMDEEDAFAILTRRLINDYPHFKSAENRQMESTRILMSSNSIPVGTTYFTGLRTLYEVNKTLLRSEARLRGDTPRDPEWNKPKLFITSRPDEKELEEWYDEIVCYWDALLHVIPDMKKPPEQMRNDSGAKSDHIFFRPIGQEYVMAPTARFLLDISPKKDAKQALAPMAKIQWNLREYPWRGLMAYKAPVTEKHPNHWLMRNESRQRVKELALEFAKHMAKQGGELNEKDMYDTWRWLYEKSDSKEDIGNTWKKKIHPLLNF